MSQNRIVIEVRGGLVADIHAEGDIDEIILVDWDNINEGGGLGEEYEFTTMGMMSSDTKRVVDATRGDDVPCLNCKEPVHVDPMAEIAVPDFCLACDENVEATE